MKTKLTLFFVSIFSIFAPIELCSIILMFIIFIDTVLKLISLRKIAHKSERKYNEVFKSRILRKGYIFKAAGYYILAGALFPLDYYALTPFSKNVIDGVGYVIDIPNTAIYTNILLCIFSLMELSSINENWFDMTGNNMLRSVRQTVKKLRLGIENVSDTYKNIKD